MLLAALATVGWLFFPQPPIQDQGDALAVVKFMPAAQMTSYCEKEGVPAGVYASISACTKGSYIALPNPCQWPLREAYAELVCHELGHVNGWRHEDPPEPAVEDPPY